MPVQTGWCRHFSRELEPEEQMAATAGFVPGKDASPELQRGRHGGKSWPGCKPPVQTQGAPRTSPKPRVGSPPALHAAMPPLS